MADKQWWEVTIYGYSEEVFYAETPGAARYQCYRAAREAGIFNGPFGFRDFIHRGVTTHLSDDQGDPRTPEFGAGP